MYPLDASQAHSAESEALRRMMTSMSVGAPFDPFSTTAEGDDDNMTYADWHGKLKNALKVRIDVDEELQKRKFVNRSTQKSEWIKFYHIDREKRRTERSEREKSIRQRMPNVPEYSSEYDLLRPSTPVLPSNVDSPTDVLKDEYMQPDDPRLNKEGTKPREMRREEYANFRRRYEMRLALEDQKRRLKLKEPPTSEYDVLLQIKEVAGKKFDRIGYNHENVLSSAGADELLQSNYMPIEGHPDAYALRVDEDSNFENMKSTPPPQPPPQRSPTPPPATDDVEMGDDDDEEEDFDPDDLFGDEEEGDQVEEDSFGFFQVSKKDERKFTVIKASFDNPSEFYNCIYVLKCFRTPPGASIDQRYHPKHLRNLAMGWLRTQGDKRDEMLNAKVKDDATSLFSRFLASQAVTANAEFDETSGSSSYRDYDLGMVRARVHMNYMRKKHEALPPVDLATVPFPTTPLDGQAGQQKTLIDEYCLSQARQTAWATLYDVTALAFHLNICIHLYYNSGEYETDENGARRLKDDWRTYDPDVIGPESAQDKEELTYRLLWSADHQMRFSPIVEETQTSARSSCRSLMRQKTRDKLKWLVVNALGEAYYGEAATT